MDQIFFDEADFGIAGKCLLASLVGSYAYTATRPEGRGDVCNAIQGYLPQALDRSVLSARLEQERLSLRVARMLQLDELRQRIRSSTDKQAKVDAWSALFRASIVAFFTSAYANSLVLNLFAMKNVLRVVHFVVREREMMASTAEVQARGGGPTSVLRSWWSGGMQSALLTLALARMPQQEGSGASPFSAEYLDEGVGFSGGTNTTQAEKQPIQLISQLHNRMAVEHFLSILQVVQRSLPAMLQCATAAVEHVVAQRGPQTLAITSPITSAQLRSIMCEIAEEMAATASITEWMSGVAELGEDSMATPRAPNAVHVDDDASSEESMELPTTMMADLPRSDVLRDEELARAELASSLWEVIHDASFDELTLRYAADLLELAIASLTDLSKLDGYDASTDSVATLRLAVSLEAARDQIGSVEHDISPYLRLFCEEMIRSSCA